MPLLSIAENIFLGNERARGGVIDWFETFRAHRRRCCARSACTKPPTTLVTDLGVGKQQLVEIAKALAKEVQLLILDEPTASLQRDRQRCAARRCCWSSRRTASPRILISHKLNEVAQGGRHASP